METYSNILVAIDLSDNCIPALKKALSMQQGTSATVTVLYVLEKGAESEAFDSIYKDDVSRQKLSENYALPEVENWLDQLPFDEEVFDKVSIEVRIGNPADEIVEFANTSNTDLIIAGTHGRTGVERLWIGSVAERVVRIAPCAVMTIPSQPDRGNIQ